MVDTADASGGFDLVASFFTLTGSGFGEEPRNSFPERCRAAAAAGFTGIDLGRQLRQRPGLALPIAVTFDDYDYDTLEHRLLRAAVTRLGQIGPRHEHTRRNLAWLRHQFTDVTETNYDPRHVPEPTWTRLNNHYRPAVNLARLVLMSSTTEARTGEHHVAVFLVDMNQVFEDFVRACLRQHLHLTPREFPNGKQAPITYLDQERGTRLEPDLTWWKDGRCRFIGDCKYKRPGGTIGNADLYQMLAYLTAFDLPTGLLIYPHTERSPGSVTVTRAGKRVDVVTVDLTRDQTDLRAALNEIAQRARLNSVERRNQPMPAEP